MDKKHHREFVFNQHGHDIIVETQFVFDQPRIGICSRIPRAYRNDIRFSDLNYNNMLTIVKVYWTRPYYNVPDLSTVSVRYPNYWYTKYDFHIFVITENNKKIIFLYLAVILET